MTYTKELQKLPPDYATFVDQIKQAHQFDLTRLLLELVDWLSQQPSEQNYPLPKHPAEASLIAVNLPPCKMLGYGEPLPEGSSQQVALAFIVSLLHWNLMETKKIGPQISEPARRLFLALKEFAALEDEIQTWIDNARKNSVYYNPKLQGVQETLLGAEILEDLILTRQDLSELLLEASSLGVIFPRGPVSPHPPIAAQRKAGRKSKWMLTAVELHLKVCGYSDKKIAALIDDLGDKDLAVQRVGDRRRQNAAKRTRKD
jgi:hypothetical protein